MPIAKTVPFALARPNRTVAIMHFVVGYEGSDAPRDATPDAIAKNIAKLPFDVSDWWPITEEDLPARALRNAWRADGRKIVVDSVAANALKQESAIREVILRQSIDRRAARREAARLSIEAAE